jgi:cation diffusion facilitator family transporter
MIKLPHVTLWTMVANSPRFPTTQRFLLAALWLELLVLTVKVFVGWQTNSLALLATALYCPIAAVSAVYALMATYNLQRCGRSLWGHSNWEAGTALLLVSVLGFGCFTLSGVALQRLAASPSLNQIAPIGVTAAQLQTLLMFGLASLTLAWFAKRSAKQNRMMALTMNGAQVLQEALISLGMLVALAVIQQGYTWLDPLLALGLSMGAGLSAWRMLLRQMPLMLRQVAIAPEAIAQVVRQVDGVTNCYQVQSRGLVGRQVLIHLRLQVHPEFLGTEGRMIQEVEARLRETYGPVKVMVKVDSDWNGLEEALETNDRASSSLPEVDWR